MPLWDTKQRQGHPLHAICAYQASFPPQLPAYFLDRFPKAKTILDPFCGRGTVLLEAALRGRQAIGFDALPTAVALSAVKLHCPPLQQVLEEIANLDLSQAASRVTKKFLDLYHPKTWTQVRALRRLELSPTLRALALGRLHGHSPGFFSNFTFNVVSLSPEALRRQRKRNQHHPKYGKQVRPDLYGPRNVRDILMGAARRFIPKYGLRAPRGSFVGLADSRRLPLPARTVDLVITSPPFFDVVDYSQVNWVREWFLGSKPSKVDTFTLGNESRYVEFLRGSLIELARVLRPRGAIVFEVGPVKRQMRMDKLVERAAEGVLHVDEVVVNDFSKVSVPKISRAMRSRTKTGEQTTTVKNLCMVLR